MATSFVTTSDGTEIAYDTMGEGRAIVLIHGFGANRKITWENTGWCEHLAAAGHRVVAIDCRGHGESGKPHDAEDYDEGRMAADAMAVLADLAIPSADVMGYSMGGQIAIRLMQDAGGRIRRVILGGVGGTYFQARPEEVQAIAKGLLEKDPKNITDPVAREYRTFCERAGDDLYAMAACIRRHRRIFSRDEMRQFPQQVLVVCGEDDRTSGRPEPLAECFTQGQAVVLPKRSHHSAVGDKDYKEAAVNFLIR